MAQHCSPTCKPQRGQLGHQHHGSPGRGEGRGQPMAPSPEPVQTPLLGSRGAEHSVDCKDKPQNWDALAQTSTPSFLEAL